MLGIIGFFRRSLKECKTLCNSFGVVLIVTMANLNFSFYEEGGGFSELFENPKRKIPCFDLVVIPCLVAFLT